MHYTSLYTLINRVGAVKIALSAWPTWARPAPRLRAVRGFQKKERTRYGEPLQRPH